MKLIKRKKKDIKKNSNNFVSNPGSKLSIINENVGASNNTKYDKIPDKLRKKNTFSNQFVHIDHTYKKNK